jgi:hypothetical protein
LLVNIPGPKRLTINVGPDVGLSDYDLETSISALSSSISPEVLSQLIHGIEQQGIKNQLMSLRQAAITTNKTISLEFLADGNIIAHTSEEATPALEELSFDEILAQEGLEDEDDD